MWKMCLILIGGLMCTAPLAANQIQWQDKAYSHQAEGEPLPQLLRSFLSDQGVVAVISEGVIGHVTGRFEYWKPERFFNHMVAAHGLIWYHDGHVLYIYAGEEVDSRFISLDALAPDTLKTYLQQAGIADTRFAPRFLAEHLVYVSGPQRYVELVEQTARILDQTAARAAMEAGMATQVRVFPLQYAWAADQELTVRNRKVVVPGVVSLLTDLLRGGSTQPRESFGEYQDNSVPKLKGQGLARGSREPADKPPIEEAAIPTDTGFQPYMVADMRTNAIVIRDRAENMDLYSALIAQLDTKPGLVEIRASIIDVSNDFSRELGVDWRREKEGDVGGGFNASDDLLPGNPYVGGNGLRLTTLFGDATDFFLARINAMEEDGNARVLSRPGILTTDNAEARLEHGSTFYVRVAGDREVDLFSVDVGVQLRVTPHIIDENGQRSIRMSVHVEDGSVEEQGVDGIPILRRGSITTQAMVREGESLLLGGYLRESESDAEERVPGLGRIPVFKYLFSKKRKGNKRMERLFLISPRIIDPTNPDEVSE